MSELNRKGALSKCPACGWKLDHDAYRCPKCRIYFCYKCRARVGERENQYQCMNQACKCHGKLLCAACVQPVAVKGVVPNPDATKATLIAGGVAGVAGAVVGAPLLAAGAIGVAGVVGSSFLLRKLGFNIWLTKDGTKQNVGERLCCIACKSPVKHLRR